MRQIVSYTPEELAKKPAEIQFLKTTDGTFMLVNGIELRKPGIKDYLFRKEGRQWIADKIKRIGSSKVAKTPTEIPSEYNWRQRGGRHEWRGRG